VATTFNSMEIQKGQLETLIKKPRSGRFIRESDEIFEHIYTKLQYINNNCHNLISRNLLISLGCHSAIRRVGDVYTRMDAVYSSPEKCFGAVEVEFGHDSLDAARCILDD